ncbi:mycofactocin-coupled SDR family oxidoreductase [Agromyces archimandritae]|uniref:Mycofactocin-coupled SDR family oxidoreductase n=1 Tax=Agromyces archimandritae TaxID=2781962 RepID=A0A975FQG2_9MICO|nr:mycofactocin-coupled SDR family oxidoreductase [Agromyces archimandritae]QTX05326.1 mycofactocin-coupled SDR family oxidoreductase [Agromyces archimandritae]
MTGRLEGKVAFITGGAKGQGRSHAVRLAQEGADIITVDILGDIPTAPYPQGTEADLAETVRQVEALDRRIIAKQADVRDYEGLKAALDEGVAALGRLDIVSANAGIVSGFAPSDQLDEQTWRDMIDINLTGVWHTTKAATPHLRASGGGSITITSSVVALKAAQNVAHYVAAKTGLIGLMRTLALELAPDRIRVNTIHPTTVKTDMTFNEPTYRVFRPDLENPTEEDFIEATHGLNPYPINLIDPVDLSNAIVFLASDEARYVTGIEFPVDAGNAIG